MAGFLLEDLRLNEEARRLHYMSDGQQWTKREQPTRGDADQLSSANPRAD